jgi:AcrR family transcriptional regulator
MRPVLYDMSMNAGRTARERARSELTNEIKQVAAAQLASAGADGLSLRAVARELGMASSAVYRYFPSRDDLLTALIIDAYDSLGDAVEAAAAGHREPFDRWRGIWTAARRWAIDHRQEYALIYGSPIPGYRAPQDTVGPGIRVPLTLLDVLHDGWQSQAITVDRPEKLPPDLARQAAEIARATAVDIPQTLVARGVIAWSQLFGMLSFELFGQFVGSFDPTDLFFEYAVTTMARFVGFTP